MEMDWPGHVCLVGNGPLSEADRGDIAACPFVVRFNDAKNALEGEPFDVLVRRENGEAGFHGPFKTGSRPVVLVLNPGSERAPPPLGSRVVEIIAHPATIFGAPTTSPDASWGATTGAVLLHHLNQRGGSDRLSTFGMNFLRSEVSEHMHDEGAVLRRHIPELDYHPPPRSTYLPGA